MAEAACAHPVCIEVIVDPIFAVWANSARDFVQAKRCPRPPGDIVVGATPTGFAVASLKEIIPADPKKNKTDAQNLKDQLRTALTTDAISQYLASLRQRYPVEINQTALDFIAGRNSGG